MPVPKFDEMLFPVLSILSDGGVWTNHQVEDAIAERFRLSDEDRAVRIKSGRPQYVNNALWAITHLKQARLIDSEKRGTYRITESGKSLLATGVTRIDKQCLMRYPSYVEFIDRSAKSRQSKNSQIAETAERHAGDAECPAAAADETGAGGVLEGFADVESPEDAIDSSMRQIRQALADELLDAIMQQTPPFFERLVVHLLCAMGYGDMQPDAATVTQQSGDGGIDGIVREDRLGFDKIYVQAKRWELSHTVGSPEVQAFVGALTGVGADKGLFITTAAFSKKAREFATRQHAAKLVLVDGQTLAGLMIDHNVGVSTRTTYELKALDRDFFEA